MARRVSYASLPVVFFKEGDKVVAYSPALDLSSFGDDLEDARSQFAEAVDLFFKELAKMGTLEQVLIENGWKQTHSPHKGWEPPQLIGNLNESIKIPVPA